MKKALIYAAIFAVLYILYKKANQNYGPVGGNYFSTYGPKWKGIIAGEIPNANGEFLIDGKWQYPWFKDPVTDQKTAHPNYILIAGKWQKKPQLV